MAETMLASLMFGAAVALAPSIPAAAKGEACLRVVAPLAADDVPVSNRFEPAACDASLVARAFRYDRSEHVTRAARPLSAGDVVRRYPEFGAHVIAPGQTLRLVAVSGVVRVERKVEALQEARDGQRVFVKGGDGQVLSVQYDAGAR